MDVVVTWADGFASAISVKHAVGNLLGANLHLPRVEPTVPARPKATALTEVGEYRFCVALFEQCLGQLHRRAERTQLWRAWRIAGEAKLCDRLSDVTALQRDQT